MAEASLAELEALAVDLEQRPPAVDEVELVLEVVEVAKPAGAGREHHRVRAERRDAELPAHLAKDAVSEVLEARVRVAHNASSITASSHSPAAIL